MSIFLLALFSHASASTGSTLPDNVSITNSPDGSSTTVVINDKPGYITNVSTSCINGKCTNSATSTAMTEADINNMKNNMIKQQEVINAFFAQQEEFFKAQEKLWQSMWGTNFF